MATINRNTGSENESFKQIDSDSWSSIYLPAICAGVIMTVVLFVAIACSKKSDNSASRISPPTQPTTSSAPAPLTAAAPLPEKPKRIKKHRPANVTYVSGTYGVSFSYPRKYSLAAGSEKSPMPLQTSFLKPGAVEVAAVDMPDDTYPDTDFSSGLLNVSVNPGMTAEECAQFVPFSPYSKDADSKNAEVAKPTTVKLGANEFTELEQMGGETTHQSDMKYFHLFKNGACYEFALDVETARKADEELAQVDRGQVFKQLEKVLTTARIKEVQVPGVEKTETATTSSSPELNAIEGKSADEAPADSKSADVKTVDSKSSDSKPAATTTDDASKAEAATTPTSDSKVSDSKTEKAQAVTPDQK